MPREIEGELEMKLANEMMKHMDGEPCVEELKNEIERLKRENETLRENYVKDMAEAASAAYIGVCALTSLNMVKAILGVGKMPTEEMFSVLRAGEADECFSAMPKAAISCLKNDGDCSEIIPKKHLILALLRRINTPDAVAAVKMGLVGVNTDKEAVKILDSLPSHNCQILKGMKRQ